ncbi:MAG TPA: hypothetical protein VGM70_06085 [Pseudolysinimonas sp.]|jgi:hypothetical protein
MGVLDDMGRAWDASQQMPKKSWTEKIHDMADGAEAAVAMQKAAAAGAPAGVNGVSYDPFANMAAMNAGVHGSATVVAIADTGTKLADTPVYDVTMDVVADGQPGFRTVHRQVIAAAALGNWQAGKVLPVRFDPNDAGHQITIG